MREREGAPAARRAGGDRLGYANVVATLALIVAIGAGGAYAANLIGPRDIAKNAVRSRHIKRGQVKGSDLATNAVGTGVLQDGAVTAAKLAADVEGPPGPPGPPGDQGEVGPTFGANLGADATPVPTPDITLGPASGFSLPTPGRIFISANASILVATCDAGAPHVGLYVDGNPVPGSERLTAGLTLHQFVITGVSDHLAPGIHQMTTRLDCPDGNVLTASIANQTASVVLIGE